MSDKGPKYPGVVVKLSGREQNPFAVINRVMKSMRSWGVGPGECNQFRHEAMESDPVAVAQRWVQVR